MEEELDDEENGGCQYNPDDCASHSNYQNDPPAGERPIRRGQYRAQDGRRCPWRCGYNCEYKHHQHLLNPVSWSILVYSTLHMSNTKIFSRKKING